MSSSTVPSALPAASTSFADLGLPGALVESLRRVGIETAFPIQTATIPDVLDGRDLLGRAATGSGKTLAFGLPMISRLSGHRAAARRPRGLVLVPTRELAIQVAEVLAPLARTSGVRVLVVAGGLPIGKQVSALRSGVDLVVATPGRLLDLIDRHACELGAVEITVLDEADHMCDLGFLPAVRTLLAQTPARGQRLLFSATLDKDVSSLVKTYLNNPAEHSLAAAQASIDTMSHHVFRVPFEKKFDLVAAIAAREGRTICFVRTKHGADRIARNLGRAGVGAGALHGGRTQAQRNKALAAFKDGSVPVLVATDVAARGIHVDDVSLVLHVDPPQDGKDYLHRSGRTARAGDSGVIVLLTTPSEERSVKKMLSQVGVRSEHRDAVAGDPAVARLTGARTPSGVPIAQLHMRTAPTVSPGARGGSAAANGRGATTHRGRPAHRPRPAAGGPSSTSRARHDDRRPRRARAR